MISTLRTHAHLGALSVLTAAAVTAALAAVPATAADGTTAATTTAPASRPTAPSAQLVTLVTGDRVVLRHDGAGRTTASLTAGSPHHGRPVEHVAAGTHIWVVPKLAPSVRSKLDPSLFDVSALATRSGRVPLTVTFAPGTSVRDLPGIDVRSTTARRAAGGRTAATASYDARRPLPTRLATSLAGVSRIAVRGATDGTARLGPAYELHTLTINGTNADGAPLPGSDVFVMNLDDARLFGAFGGIIDGQWKVSVPTGTYLIIADDFNRTVVSTTSVTGDTTTSFTMADATVKPSMTLPGHQNLSPSMDIIASDASGNGGVDFGYGGFRPKLNPVPALPVGELTTEVGNLWTAKGYEPFGFDGHTATTHPIKQVVAAKEVVDGIPRHPHVPLPPGRLREGHDPALRHRSEGEGLRRVVRLVPERRVRVRRHLSLDPPRRHPRHVRGEQGPQLGQLHLGERELPELHPARGSRRPTGGDSRPRSRSSVARSPPSRTEARSPAAPGSGAGCASPTVCCTASCP